MPGAFPRASIIALLLAAAAPAPGPGARAAETRTAPAATATSDYVVREWRVEDGLPHDDVFQVFQDRTGFLWVACRGTLARFDGTTFVPQTAPAARDIFYSLAEETAGDLLLVGREGDRVRARAGAYAREPLPAPFAGRPAIAVLRAGDGASWYALRGAALRIADGNVRAFGADAGLAGDDWTRLATDGAGRVWVANHGFLARYEAGRLARLPLDGPADELRLASSRRDGPWLITAREVWKFDAQDRAVVVAKVPQLLSAHYVNAAVEDRRGALWLGTRSAGLHRLDAGHDQAVALSSDHVTSLFIDRDDVLWVGTAAGGLAAVAPRVCTLFGKASGLAGAPVQAVCADDAGDVWVANGDAGVLRFRNGKIDRWPLRHGGRDFAAGAVSRRAGGGVWATGGTGSALFAVADDGAPPAMREDLDAGRIHASLFTTSSGDLWFTTADRRVGRLRNPECRLFGPAEGVGPRGVRTFAEPSPGRLLVGTNDGALLEFAGERFGPTAAPVQVPSALNAILALDDELWLGTAAHGIALVRGDRLAYLGAAHGLPDDTVTQLVADGRGFVWCGSGRGVFRLALDDVRRFARGETSRVFPLRLGKDEGVGAVHGQGIYGPGVAHGRDGRIWFASRQGVLAVDPSAETLAPAPPRARIEEVLADETPLPATAGRARAVSPDVRKLEFRFSVLCLSAPSRVLVRYRLEGFDAGWKFGKPGEPATYPRLPAGDYRFEVSAGFDDTAGPAATDALDITVRPRWWQTWWFGGAATSGAIGAIALGVRAWAHRRLRRRIANLEREAEVARVRERIARDIHDDVGASLTRISLLAHGGAPDSPAAAALAQIDETAREVTRSLDEIVWAVNPQCDTLEGVAVYLTNFAQKFLGSAKVRCRLTVPPALPEVPVAGDARHDLFLCFREVLHNVVKHAHATEVAVRVSFVAPTLEIVVADDGRGLTAAHAAAGEAPDRVASGNGLGNLRRRMARLGGSCAIESSTRGGTTVTLRAELPGAPAPSAR